MKLGAAINAFTRDVANDFILDKDYNSLGQDFDATVPHHLEPTRHIWRVGKHIRWFTPFMKAIPTSLITKVVNEGMKAEFQHITVSPAYVSFCWGGGVVLRC